MNDTLDLKISEERDETPFQSQRKEREKSKTGDRSGGMTVL